MPLRTKLLALSALLVLLPLLCGGIFHRAGDSCTQVSTGQSHSCALSADGSLDCLGGWEWYGPGDAAWGTLFTQVSAAVTTPAASKSTARSPVGAGTASPANTLAGGYGTREVPGATGDPEKRAWGRVMRRLRGALEHMSSFEALWQASRWARRGKRRAPGGSPRRA